jgi:hypothetical protein
MVDKYKTSKELGRQPPSVEEVIEEEVKAPSDIMNTSVENAEVSGDFFWKNGYSGSAENCIVLKSDIIQEIRELERITAKTIVGLIFLEDGTVMTLMEKIQ